MNGEGFAFFRKVPWIHKYHRIYWQAGYRR
jgi:hypothetical protein